MRHQPRVPHALRDVRLFEGLDERALLQVRDAAVEVAREAGAAFFSQDETAGRWFVLAEGRVRLAQLTVEGQQITVRYVAPGDVFGCVPLFGGTTYPATAVAVTTSVAYSWDRAVTDVLMQRWPSIALHALSMVGDELATMRERYRELATERVEQRIAHALLRLVREAGARNQDGILIDVPLSRQDLAELAGTTLHTVSRTMSAWEDRGVVISGRSRVTVRDLGALARLAGEPAGAA